MSPPVPWLDRLAHDLRGPLMPLQTAAYLLRSGHLEPERQQELFAQWEALPAGETLALPALLYGAPRVSAGTPFAIDWE